MCWLLGLVGSGCEVHLWLWCWCVLRLCRNNIAACCVGACLLGRPAQGNCSALPPICTLLACQLYVSWESSLRVRWGAGFFGCLGVSPCLPARLLLPARLHAPCCCHIRLAAEHSLRGAASLLLAWALASDVAVVG